MKKDSPAGGPTGAKPPHPQAFSSGRLLLAAFGVLALLWTLTSGWVLMSNVRHNQRAVLELARVAARTLLQEDLLHRQWASEHGGVYVPMTEKTPPDPYLASFPERDITTPSGRKLTLINPAAMTRQVDQLGRGNREYHARIISLSPLRPENAADVWETNGLRAIERGQKEVSAVEEVGGRPQLRLMLPMVTDRHCLSCHAAQGFKEGETRGALSVSLPLDRYSAQAKAYQRQETLSASLIWLLGMTGLGGSCFYLHRRARDRDQAALRLRTLQTELEDFYEHAPDMFCSVDSVSGRIVACNQALVEKTGRHRQDLLGLPVLELYHPACLQEARTAFAKFQSSGELRNIQLELQGKAGTRIDVELNASAIRNERGQIVRSRSVLRDISEQNQLERALRDSEARFRQLFERAPVAYQSLDAEGRILEVNLAWLEMLGHTREDVIGKPVTDFMVPEHVEQCRQRFSQFLANGEAHGTETDFRRKDGSVVTVSVEGRVGYDERKQFERAHCALYDLTARKQAEQALRESEQRYRLLFDEGTEGMAVADFETGLVLDCNKALLELVGWEKSALVGQHQSALHAPEDRGNGTSPTFKQHRGEKRGQVLEATLITKAGVRKAVEIKATVLDLNGRRVVQGFFRDVSQRKQAELALQESEDRYRRLFNGITDAVFVHEIREDDLPGAFLAVNDALCRRLGYGREELLQMTVLDIDAPESTVDRQEIVRKLKCGENVLFEQLHVAKDRHRIPVEIHVQAFQLQGRTVILSVSRDITERKRISQALVESEAQLRLVWENALDAMRLTDEHGIVRRVNQAYCRLMGKPREALEGQLFTCVYDAAHQAPYLAAYQRRFRERIFGTHFERTLTLWNGKTVSVDLSSAFLALPGQPEMVFNIIRDVGERRKAEEALRDSEANLAASQRIAHLGSWERGLNNLADPHANPLRWSDEVFRIFGYEPGQIEVSVQNFFRAVHPDDRHAIQAAVCEAVQEHKPYRLDHRIVLPDGTERVVHEQAEVVVHPATNRPIKLVGTVQDITEQKRAEQARTQLEAQLRQAQKMEAVGQLAGGVAHDFNNILTVVLGNAGLLTDDASLTRENQDLARQIADAAARAANLTRQLLAFSRKQVMQVRPLDLNVVLGQILKMLQRVLGEQITLQCTYAPELPPVLADAGMVEQVIMNLAVNARDAMPKGGRLLVATEVRQVSPEHARRNAEARVGWFVTLTIADTGCGMESGTLARIFEPFFTTKEVGKGTGLGLATVYGIVKQHNGWVEVASEVGHGSTFTVYLEAAHRKAEQEEQDVAFKDIPGGHETILLVEDDAPVRFLARSCLERCGYRVVEAAHGPEALKVWEEQRGQIDLLLTDVVMPEGMNGRELAETLRRAKPDLKVLFSSGYSRDILSAQTDLSANDAYLPKPYDPFILARTVRSCLDEA
ncbi:MAG: PAS domain S-box protein [Verrucomicrobia bacterium]|nr:PAS domain S-box protein [Verrucomicrobiota bacterium]